MKKAKIVLILSALVFIALLIFYITNPANKKQVVSKREQYQQELIDANKKD